MQKLLQQLGNAARRPIAQARGLPAELYRSPAIAEREMSKIFRRDWTSPGLASEIPEPGDYLTWSIAQEPVFVVRDKSGTIRCFANVCRHRMMQLLQGRGTTSKVICPYHAWTYDLNGQLVGAGHMQRSEGFNKSDICLPEIRVEIWQGWIYLTLNPEATDVAECLKGLEQVVSRYDMARYIPVLHQDHVWNTNWKLLCENFMEGYHLPVAHKATVGAWFPVGETRFPETVAEYYTYQTFKKSGEARYGLAHKNNKTLKDEWRETSVLPTVFPTHMYVLAPDHLWYLSLRPRGVGQVDVRFGVAIAPEVEATLDDREEWMSGLNVFFDHVNAEDRFVVEGIYKGALSSFAAPGNLSWLEREIHDFQKYLARRLVPKKER